MSGGCRGRGEQEVASFSACFFCPVVCSPGIWWRIFPGNILYVKAPTFLHRRKRRGFFVTIWGVPESYLPLVPGHLAGSVSFAGAREEMLCREAVFLPPADKSGFQAVRTGRILGWLQRKDLALCRPYPSAARPGTVPSRLPGACAANAPPGGHWRTRLRYRRHWPPGPWRSGRIWNCPWPGRRGASIR